MVVWESVMSLRMDMMFGIRVGIKGGKERMR